MHEELVFLRSRKLRTKREGSRNELLESPETS